MSVEQQKRGKNAATVRAHEVTTTLKAKASFGIVAFVYLALLIAEVVTMPDVHEENIVILDGVQNFQFYKCHRGIPERIYLVTQGMIIDHTHSYF